MQQARISWPTLAPLNAARTAQRTVPAPFNCLSFARNRLVSRTVKLNSLTLAFLVLFFGPSIDLSAQPHTDERREFETIKAKAERGDAQAQVALGFLYASGSGVARDLRKAAKWYRKAAEQGLARAQLLVAREYAEGEGVKPDKSEAFKWFRRAADRGLAEAQFELGQCYAKGEGVSEDVVEAVKWYQRAAGQNLVEAIEALGQCFLEGTGVTADIVEGVKWIRKAAELGYAPAQYRLGLCYLNGQGVAKDFVQAYKWLNLGAAQGGALALDIKVTLAKAQSNMTPEQIAEAQRLAFEFKPQTVSAESSVATTTNERPEIVRDGDHIVTNKGPGGLLSVAAQDVTYEVYVDGSFVGNPLAKLRLQEGTHVVEVKKPGFRDYRKEIKVSNGSELNLHVTLEAQ
jgi:TPR repeat protein